MNCKHVEKHIADYVAGQVDPVIAGLIERHLETCDSCREKFETEKSVTDFLRQADAPDPSASITTDVLQKLKDIDLESRDTALEYSVQKSGSRLKWLAVISVVLGLIAVGLLIIPFGSRLNQQSVGNQTGPGFTWLGDIPIDAPDPFSLESLGDAPAHPESPESQDSEDRVIHTLDFETVPDLNEAPDTPDRKEREP
ncbi:MAG TPA: zf-HC2 domain-containing protein [bacterium]|nr:zf-HC2 domain-containing protein [bacterium]